MLIKLLVVCLCLHLANSTGGWQASGYFTPDNITKIHNSIDKMLNGLANGSITMSDMAKTISDDLNTAWDPAWNVFVIGFDNPDQNGVVYGYAYKDHWFWENNYHKAGVATNKSFIIWKDYNCDHWGNFDGGIGY